MMYWQPSKRLIIVWLWFRIESEENFVKRKKFLILVLMVSFLVIMVGCSGQEETSAEEVTDEMIVVTDALGRTIELEGVPEKVVATGWGSLRLYTYVADLDKLVGVEEIEKKDSPGRPYNYASPEFADLPTIGAGGPQNAPDPEQLLKVEPDVIFTSYASDAAAAEDLEGKTGIPVVVLDYGQEGIFGESLYNSINIVGEVMGVTEKSKEVVDYLKESEADLEKRTKDIDGATKKTAYIGGLGSKGAQGLTSTRADYDLFNALNVLNVADETGKTGGLMIDKEQLIEWNPEIIFVDYSSLADVQENMVKEPGYFDTLTAFKNDDVYMILPYNAYTTNIDTALADAYYMGSILYPDEFKDIDPAKKADEIYETLVRMKVYDRMVADYGEFGKLSEK